MTFAITRPHPEVPGAVQYVHIKSERHAISWTDKAFQARPFASEADLQASGLYLPTLMQVSMHRLPSAAN
jgi:hypothetical protein